MSTCVKCGTRTECQQCGSDEATGTAALVIEPVSAWETYLRPATVVSMQPESTSMVGEGFRTLWLSCLVRQGIVDAPSVEALTANAFRDHMVPVLEKIADNFTIVGTLTKPSVMPLAVTDLTKPFSIFCLVSVTDDGTLGDKLKSLDLTALLHEGSVATIGQIGGVQKSLYF